VKKKIKKATEQQNHQHQIETAKQLYGAYETYNSPDQRGAAASIVVMNRPVKKKTDFLKVAERAKKE
jgi:hypothetical protein